MSAAVHVTTERERHGGAMRQLTGVKATSYDMPFSFYRSVLTETELRQRLNQGMAEGVKDLPPGVALPLESNLVYANGVSFSKGCYLGQELTARTHHTGVVRKRIMPVSLLRLPEGTRVVEGAAVTTADGKSVGKLRTHDGDVGLALVRLAHANEQLHVSAEGGHALELKTSVPDWWHKDGGGDKNE